jgi:hypothetical protein
MIIKENILFSNEECQIIINENQIGETNWNMRDRNYNSYTIEYSLGNQWIFDKLKSFFEIQTSLKFIKNKEQIHFHKFIKGDWFGLHNDVREKRLCAVGVLLNNDFEGGNFKLYNPNEITLNKEIGNTYVFDVRIKHEITPILNGIRYSLLWFLEFDNIKIKINNLI